MKVSLTVLVCFSWLYSISQQNYWHYFRHSKAKTFYYDFYLDYAKDEKGVQKKLIYHFWAGKKDSLLEKEILFNTHGKPIEIKTYGVPAKDGIVWIDSLFYDNRDLLVKTQRILYRGDGKTDTAFTIYDYDTLKRETMRYEYRGKYDHPTYYSSYDETRQTKTIVEKPNDIELARTLVYYRTDGKIDSIRFLRVGEWVLTDLYSYDNSMLTESVVTKYSNTTVPNYQIEYDTNGKIKDLVAYNWLNWNHSKRFDVERKFFYNSDGSVREIIYYLNGKKKFTKKHFYTKE